MRLYSLERSLSREERAQAAGSTPGGLVGRDVEKAELHGAYYEAVSSHGGTGQLTWRVLYGEMGIGKSALASAFIAELPPNARLVRAEASPARSEVPYGGIGDLVRDAVGITGDEPYEHVVRLIAKAGGSRLDDGEPISPLVHRLAEVATHRSVVRDDDDPAARRKQVVTATRHLLAAIALQQPLVVVIESLQWADRPSLDLLAELVRQPAPLPIFVLLVTRPDERIVPVVQGIVRIELRELSAEEQVRLVETRLAVREGVRQVCMELVPRVGGNPFYLLEMLDALLERGALEIREVEGESGERIPVLLRSENAEADFLALPSTLEQLVADRLRELPKTERALVDWLAVADGPITIADLRTLAGLEDDEACVRLCARGMCERRGEFLDFRHPVSRDVAKGALDAHRASGMHRALGLLWRDTSMARGLSAAIVARHLSKGRAPDLAAHLYLEAAHAARVAHQLPLAVRYFKRAIGSLSANDDARFDAHEALENIYRSLGRRRERLAHLVELRREARRRNSARAGALALLRTARFHQDEGHFDRGLVASRRAAKVARVVGQPALEVEAEGLLSEFLRELGDVQGALAASDRALAVCAAPGVAVPERARGEVLRARGVLLRRVGRVREAVDAYVDAIAYFKKEGAQRQEARAKSSLAYSLFVQGRYEDAVALGLESIRLTLSVGGRFQIANTLTNVGQAYARLGDVERALAYFAKARQAHVQSGEMEGYADTLVVHAEVLLEAGRIAEAESLLQEATPIAESSRSGYDLTHLGVARTALTRAKGNTRLAVEYALAARRSAETQALVSFHYYALALEAAARADAGEFHTATLLATTALGSVETLQGCEYGLELRALCISSLERAGSAQLGQLRERAVDHTFALMSTIRDRRLRRLFATRPPVAAIFQRDDAHCVVPQNHPSVVGEGAS
jgi:tetratricopeptide (TPR) repeat protein